MGTELTIQKMHAALRMMESAPLPIPKFYAGPNMERWLLDNGVPPHMIVSVPLTLGDAA